MKKILLTIVIAALLIFPVQGVLLGSAAETASDALSTPTYSKYVPGSAPAQTDAAQAVTPAIHAAVLAMINHDLTAFDFSSAELGWETLYNMLSLYGQMDERSDYDADELILPAESVRDFSGSLFPNLSIPAPLPAELADRMTYSAGDDSYRLVCGNDSLAQIRLASLLPSGDNLILSGSLVYLVDGSDLASFRAILRPSDNLFGYTIVALELI